jgi:hypothetical protein
MLFKNYDWGPKTVEYYNREPNLQNNKNRGLKLH